MDHEYREDLEYRKEDFEEVYGWDEPLEVDAQIEELETMLGSGMEGFSEESQTGNVLHISMHENEVGMLHIRDSTVEAIKSQGEEIERKSGASHHQDGVDDNRDFNWEEFQDAPEKKKEKSTRNAMIIGVVIGTVILGGSIAIALALICGGKSKKLYTGKIPGGETGHSVNGISQFFTKNKRIKHINNDKEVFTDLEEKEKKLRKIIKEEEQKKVDELSAQAKKAKEEQKSEQKNILSNLRKKENEFRENALEEQKTMEKFIAVVKKAKEKVKDPKEKKILADLEKKEKEYNENMIDAQVTILDDLKKKEKHFRKDTKKNINKNINQKQKKERNMNAEQKKESATSTKAEKLKEARKARGEAKEPEEATEEEEVEEEEKKAEEAEKDAEYEGEMVADDNGLEKWNAQYESTIPDDNGVKNFEHPIGHYLFQVMCVFLLLVACYFYLPIFGIMMYGGDENRFRHSIPGAIFTYLRHICDSMCSGACPRPPICVEEYCKP